MLSAGPRAVTSRRPRPQAVAATCRRTLLPAQAPKQAALCQSSLRPGTRRGDEPLPHAASTASTCDRPPSVQAAWPDRARRRPRDRGRDGQSPPPGSAGTAWSSRSKMVPGSPKPRNQLTTHDHNRSVPSPGMVRLGPPQDLDRAHPDRQHGLPSEPGLRGRLCRARDRTPFDAIVSARDERRSRANRPRAARRSYRTGYWPASRRLVGRPPVT